MVFNGQLRASLCACLPLIVGCGDSSLATVEGQVTMDGESIDDGSIRFLPRDGRGMVVGGPIRQGAYRIEMEPGWKRVEIRSSQLVGERVLYPEGPSVPEMRELIPAVYNHESNLQVEVTLDNLSHDFVLTLES